MDTFLDEEGCYFRLQQASDKSNTGCKANDVY